MDFIIFLPHLKLLCRFSLWSTFLIWNQTAKLISAQEFRESGANLHSVSEATIPPDSVLLDLSYNQIRTLHNGDFSVLNQLENLYLIGNGIVTIGKLNELNLLQIMNLIFHSKVVTFGKI